MKSRFALLVVTLAVIAAVINSYSQVRIVRGDSTGTMMQHVVEIFQLRELGALISSDKDHLRVDHIMPPEKRPKGYADVDLKEGDIILMANAKKVKDVAALKELYEGMKVGEVFKMGIRRDEAMMLVSFTIADSNNLPKMQMRMITAGDGGDVEALPALGLIISMKGKAVEVLDILPDGAAPKAGAMKGDIVLELNGKKAATVKAFVDTYDSLPVGSNVTLKLDRDGKPVTFSFSKPVPGGGVIKKEIK
ncbi:MAG: PDZ domain-containing protein [Bacteroidota bacterium]